MLVKICLLFLFPLGEPGQHLLSDTVELQEIAVHGSHYEKYAVGQQVVRIDDSSIKEFPGRSLADLLQQHTGLYLRQYGEGMVSSLTMRGTSAGHTAVFWNGLPLNSPSLGQSDFSLLPVGALGNIALHYGSSGALYGTDAIGGSVHLNTGLKFNQGHQAKLDQGIGSFGRVNTGVFYGYSNKKWASLTKFYRNHAENDFTYHDPTRVGRPKTRVTNAGVRQWGLVQHLGRNISPGAQISTAFWLNNTDRQIQPLMGSSSREVQEDNQLRWALNYDRFLGDNALNIKLGWVRDYLLFNRTSSNETNTYLLSGEYEWEGQEKISSTFGVRYAHVFGNLSTYDAEEGRLEVYALNTYRPWERLGVSINLRQTVYEGKSAPFSPALSGQFTILDQENRHLLIRAALSQSYKIPTLNDRFWDPGGNPALVPEEAISWETGLTYQRSLSRHGGFTAQLTYYNMAVENWIIWLPQGSIWTPSNIRNVSNQGLDLGLEGNYSIGALHLTGNLNYAYNQAVNRSKINSNDRRFGKQLPYTPLHKMQWGLRGKMDGLEISLNQIYTGERYDTSDNESVVAPYALWDVGMKYHFGLWKYRGSLSVHVYNLFNEDYQTMKLRAMPGRNYQVNMSFRL
ncbi:MAG TPA: TonB-dependent receptor [Cyclobacteriaceae bacterium]|nr:TonB-dependent receptor [Cyclobacteriaceae bacterium]